MELRKKLYTPAWRDPKLLARERHGRKLRPLMGMLTSACLILLFVPDKFEYGRAISFQLAEGGKCARLLFLLMGITLAYFSVRLWQWGSRSAAVTAIAVMATLTVIALTDPRSLLHNTAFIGLALGLCSVHAGVFYKDLDGRLFFPTLSALVGAGFCFYNLGMGERILVASTCVALYLLYYGELDP